jgi:hypothetical protein
MWNGGWGCEVNCNGSGCGLMKCFCGSGGKEFLRQGMYRRESLLWCLPIFSFGVIKISFAVTCWSRLREILHSGRHMHCRRNVYNVKFICHDSLYSDVNDRYTSPLGVVVLNG